MGWRYKNKLASRYWNQSGNQIAQISCSETDKQSHVLYLIDYELLGSPQSGLDLIEEFQLGSRAVLVTSHFDEAVIRERCQKLSVKLIPKGIAAFVPIRIQEARLRLDAILIDDDSLIRMSWQMSAKDRGLTIRVYENAQEFLCDIHQFDFRTAIYVDSNLGNGQKGEIIAQEIFNLGFKSVYLATGYQSEQFPVMSWIRGIIGKTPPWM